MTYTAYFLLPIRNKYANCDSPVSSQICFFLLAIFLSLPRFKIL